MIRPITVICWILALGAGLYLYRAKHEVELMDKHIEQVAKETSDVRADSRRLLDEWLRLGEPEQLHKYSDEYLGLKTIAPTQFARLSDLASRLPAPQADPPPEPDQTVADASAVPAAAAQPDTGTTDATDQADAEDLPVPPIPPATPVLTTASVPAVAVVPLQARPVTPRTAIAQPEPKPRTDPETHVAEEPAALAPKPTPVSFTEPRQTVPPQAVSSQIIPGPATPRAHDLPPSQARQGLGRGEASAGAPARELPPLRPSQARGLPPLQAQGSPPILSPVQPGQPVGRAVPWPVEARVADAPANDSRREVRPAQTRFADPRGPEPRMAQQATAPMPAQTGSLLGMPRGPVPLPLPAPTPVSATWTNPYGTNPSGPGR